MKQLQTREKWLLGILALVILIAAYVLLRIHPARMQLAELEKQQKSAQKKLSKARSGENLLGSVKAMEKKVDGLKQKIAVESQTMMGYQQEFVDLQQQDKQTDLKAEVTRLIERQGLVLLEMGEESQSFNNLVEATGAHNSADITRPMIKLILKGGFRQLYQLIATLENLDYTVVITRLSIMAEKRSPTDRQSQLMIDLSLAL